MKNKLGLIGTGVIILFYVIPFQDLFISYLFGKGFPIVLLKFLLLLKEVLIISLGAIVFVKAKVSPARLILTGFLLYALLSITWSAVPLFQTLVGLRTYLLIFFSFIVGERLASNEAFGLKFYKHIGLLFLLIQIFSLLEYFVLPMSIWKDPFPVMEMKREVGNLSTTNEYYDLGIPVNAFGELTRRLLGPFDEPLYMAYFTIILTNFFLAQLVYDTVKPRVKFSLGILMVTLTQTRAIIVGFLLSLAALIFKSFKIKVKYIAVAFMIAVVAAIGSLFYHEWVSTLVLSIFDKGGRNTGHIDAYIGGLGRLLERPFGSGVGAASSAVVSEGTTQATENAFINIGLEIGVLGILWIFGFFAYLIRRFRKYLIMKENVLRTAPDKTVCAAYLLGIQFTFAGLVAPHILTARIVIPFLLLMGWAYGITSKTPVNRPYKTQSDEDRHNHVNDNG